MTVLELQACRVNLSTGQVARSQDELQLTPQLTALLAWLVTHGDRAISRDELHREVWGYAPTVVSRAADVAMRRLRLQIEADPSNPRHLISVRGEGYRFVPLVTETPPPRSAPWPAAGPLIGQQEVRAAFAHQQALDPGITTLIGPPGVGKTAWLTWAGHQPHTPARSWFVSLNDVGDIQTMRQRIGAALGVPITDASQGTLQRALAANGRALLGLDGVDGLVNDAADTWLAWVREAPQLTLCLTSRERLRVADERVIAVPPLTAEASLTLFHSLRDEQGPEVLALLAQLDGLPLAIQLAAARCDVLPPSRLLERLQQRLAVLASHRRDIPARHRTLCAAFDVSWDLLDDEERAVLGACALFGDSFTLESAEAVLQDEPTLLVLDAVHRLIDKSLIEARSDHSRLSLLARVRAYAEATLTPQQRSTWGRRHAEVTLKAAEPLLLGVLPPDGTGLVRDIAKHAADLECIERRFPGEALAARATAVISPRRRHNLGLPSHLKRIEAALLTPELTPAVHASLRCAQAQLLIAQPRHDAALEILNELLASSATPVSWRHIARIIRGTLHLNDRRYVEADDDLHTALLGLAGSPQRRWELQARLQLATLVRRQGDHQRAATDLAEIAAVARLCGDRDVLGNVHIELARCAYYAGEWDDALTSCLAALEALDVQPITDATVIAKTLEAAVLGKQQRSEEALAAFEQAISFGRRIDARRWTARQLINLPTILLPMQRWDHLSRTQHEALALAEEVGDAYIAAVARMNLGLLAHRLGDPAEALRRYHEALPDFHKVSRPLGHVLLLTYVCMAAADLGQLDDAAQALQLARDHQADLHSEVAGQSIQLAVLRLQAAKGEISQQVAVQLVDELTSGEEALAVFRHIVLTGLQA